MPSDIAIPRSIESALLRLIDNPVPGSRAWELFRAAESARFSLDYCGMLNDAPIPDAVPCVEDWDPDFDPRSILIKDL